MKNAMKNSGNIAGTLVFVVIWALAVIGWVLNLIQVIQMAGDTVTGIFILKIVGIFVGPLGSILGFVG